MTEVTAMQCMVTAAAVKFESCCRQQHKKRRQQFKSFALQTAVLFLRRFSHHTQILRIHLFFILYSILCKHNKKQDSLINGARLLAIGSAACSVTEVTAMQRMVTATAVKFESCCRLRHKKNPTD